MPFVAVSMTAVMGFAALAVDLSQLADARREDQIAADQAALAAAQDLDDDAALVATVIDLAGRQTDETFDAADFDTCAAEPPPTGFTALGGTDCIAVNGARTRVRVRLPVRTQPTIFGQVVGIDSFEHTAAATAGIGNPGYGGVLPLGLPASGSGYSCLKIGSGNVPDSECNDSNSGNFGFVNLGFFGNPELGTAQACTGDGKGRVANNLAVGADHELSLWGDSPHGATAVYDAADCGALGQPNGADTLTGNIPQKFGDGLYSGTSFSDGQPARLQRPGPSWGVTASVGGHLLDDNALWEYIPTSLAGKDVPLSCHRDQFVGDDGGLDNDDDGTMAALPPEVEAHVASMARAPRMIKLLERCLDHWQGQPWTDDGALLPGDPPAGCSEPCDDPVFGRDDADDREADLWDVQYSPRFGYVPRLVEDSDDLDGDTYVRFGSYQPVFIQRVYGGNCEPGGCDVEFDPGVGYSATGSHTKAYAMTVFVIPNGMLPGDLGEADAPFRIGANRFVQLYD